MKMWIVHFLTPEVVFFTVKSGFDTEKLSIVGREYHAEEDVVGFIIPEPE